MDTGRMKSVRSIHFTSDSNEWGTPQDFFDALDAEFHFTLDAAATPANAKCDRFYMFHDNGLAQSWKGENVWLNPPYGRDIARWVAKAVSEPSEVTVMLVPARTDTKWWGLFWDYRTHRPVDGCEVRFISGRLKFGGGKREHHSRQQSSSSTQNAPFPAALVIFRCLTD